MNDGYRALRLKDGEQVQVRSKPAVCEMKRLWVCYAFRDHDLGERLAREAMQLAGALR